MKTFGDYNIDAPMHGSGEHYTTCPECSPRRNKKHDKCLSVNLEKKVWHCNHCGWSGGLPPDDLPMMQNTLQMAHKKPKPVQTAELTPDALEWLKSRCIPESVASILKLQSCKVWFRDLQQEADAVAIPFYDDSEIVNWKYRCIDEKHFSQSKGGKQCLYNLNAVRGQQKLMLCEGELDVAACLAAGFRAVCSCPNGAPPAHCKDLSAKLAFIDEAADVFEGAEQVILCTDKDEPGIPWEEALTEKIGREKCWSVSYPAGCKDAGDVLAEYGPEKLKECLLNAKPVPLAGITTFAEQTADIETYFNSGGLARGLSTGWENLDEYFRLRTGTLNIVTGIPSSGKSELLDQLMLNTIRLHGWKWALFSPENYPLPAHFQKLAEKHLQKPMFNRYAMPPMTQQELQRAIQELSRHVFLLTIDDRPATLDSILARLKVCVKRYGVKGFILDPYNELEHARPAALSETEYISQFLSTMRNFGRVYDVAMFIVSHPTKLHKHDDGSYPVPTPYDISGSANWRNKADTCLAVWRDYADEENKVQVHIQKVRDKNLGRTGFVTLHWQRATGLFFESPHY